MTNVKTGDRKPPKRNQRTKYKLREVNYGKHKQNLWLDEASYEKGRQAARENPDNAMPTGQTDVLSWTIGFGEEFTRQLPENQRVKAKME